MKLIELPDSAMHAVGDRDFCMTMLAVQRNEFLHPDPCDEYGKQIVYDE